MPDYTQFLKLIKQAALDAVETQKPAALFYGTVLNEKPLKISVEQKMELIEEQLVLTKAVTDYYVDIEVSHLTELCGDHNHEYKGRKKIKIYNGLKAGEKVLLVRFQEGQRFLVLDRVCDHTVKGQWL